MARRVARQQTLEFRSKLGVRGGRRRGAGRKKGERPRVRHRRRERLGAKTPVHVTLRVHDDLVSLRDEDRHSVIRERIRVSGHGEHFRIVHYSLQRNHIHLVAEATDREALSRGMQGFCAWTARRLNLLAGRRGQVFTDRFHAHVLRSKREVRNVLAYVLLNWRRHDEHRGSRDTIDRYSSGDFFAGWKGWHGERHTGGVVRPAWLPSTEPVPVAGPRFWLLARGWLDAGGPISPYHRPGPIA